MEFPNTDITSLEFLYEIHQVMLDKQLNLVYEGEISQEIMKTVLKMTEKNMEDTGEDTSTRKRVFNVIVECLQNISKHADQLPESEDGHSAIFIIGRDNGDYIISTGNLIINEKVEPLKNRLIEVNNMTPDELKAKYKEVIRAQGLSDKGGAGLGFIDMVKKTGNKFEFDFIPVNEMLSFFTLKVKISKN